MCECSCQVTARLGRDRELWKRFLPQGLIHRRLRQKNWLAWATYGDYVTHRHILLPWSLAHTVLLACMLALLLLMAD